MEPQNTQNTQRTAVAYRSGTMYSTSINSIVSDHDPIVSNDHAVLWRDGKTCGLGPNVRVGERDLAARRPQSKSTPA